MHELSITQNILEIALKHAQAANARKISDLYLVIGQLSSVVDDSVQFYWDMISEGTICQGAELHFKRLPALLECRDCGERYPLDDGTLTPCIQCDSISVAVVQGKEFRLDSIEIEV